jgi:hypothetical protein
MEFCPPEDYDLILGLGIPGELSHVRQVNGCRCGIREHLQACTSHSSADSVVEMKYARSFCVVNVSAAGVIPGCESESRPLTRCEPIVIVYFRRTSIEYSCYLILSQLETFSQAHSTHYTLCVMSFGSRCECGLSLSSSSFRRQLALCRAAVDADSQRRLHAACNFLHEAS